MPSTSPRRIKVTVNRKTYVVEVGDMSASPTPVTVNGRPYLVNIETIAPEVVPADASISALESVARSTPVPEKPVLPPSPAGALVRQVKAPMPGSIIDIMVKPGDQVSLGQQLCALEAMKMKSAIRSPREGVIATVDVTAGQTVAYGDVLITFE